MNSNWKCLVLMIAIIGFISTNWWNEASARDLMQCEQHSLSFWQGLPDGVDRRCRLVLPTMLERSYILCLSSKLRESVSEPVPLVLAFHGGGENANASTFQSRTQWEKSGLKYGFAVAYPNGCRVDRNQFNQLEICCDGGSWNARSSEPRGFPELCDIDDVAFVDQIIADIQQQHRIQLDKIFAVGHSKGGVFAYSLACDRAHVFAGIGTTAATLTRLLPENCQPSKEVAIFHVHNLQDPVIPFEGGGINTDFSWPAASLGLEYWIGKDNCVTSTREHNFKQKHCARLAMHCPSRIRVELCLLNEIGGDPALDPVIAHRYETYDAAFAAASANKKQLIRQAFVKRFITSICEDIYK
jgi:poly(3-hydroxybutyrate) depolymerase